jgi:hypothetical protein
MFRAQGHYGVRDEIAESIEGQNAQQSYGHIFQPYLVALLYMARSRVGSLAGASSVDGYDLAEGSGGAVASLPTGAEQVLAQLVAEPLQRPVSRVGRFHVGDI